jgi:hypothetical protein
MVNKYLTKTRGLHTELRRMLQGETSTRKAALITGI